MVVLEVFLFILTLQAVQSTNNGLKVVTKLPRNPLMKYTSYSNVMILHFVVPTDSTEAVFKFRAKDESTSMFVSSCAPRNVSVYMKPGSYPVINPDGVPFPKTFLNISRPVLHGITLLTNLKPNYINISSPIPGDWFAVAFISWTDPKKDRIEQQGLTSECEASLYAEVSVKHESAIKILSDNAVSEITLLQKNSYYYKFYVPEDIDHVIISVGILIPCKSCRNIIIFIKSGEIPNEDNYQEKLIIDVKNDQNMKIIRFFSQEDTWHYFNMTLVDYKHKSKYSKEFTEISLTLKYISGLRKQTSYNSTDRELNYFKTSINKQMTMKQNALQNMLPYKQYNLMRLTAPDNFIFEYDFRPAPNGSVPVLLNVTNNEMTVLRFSVYNIIDIGGTMTIGLAIKPELKDKTESNLNYTVVACIRKDVKEVPLHPNQCLYNNIVNTAPIVLNSSSTGTLEFFHVPYPDPGVYYLTLRAFFDECIPCNCSEECEDLYNCLIDCEYNCVNDCSNCTDICKNQVTSADGCEGCNCDGTCEIVNNTETQNASLVFSISSYPCIAGRCGKHGRCNHYMAGGFIFSSCQCFGGYRGWDCSDDSQALSDGEILIAILLLTLSNLLFIPSIYFAYKRGYYTESATYFSSMFASTFYHACDSKENQYGFCLFPLGVLQFCDFYCALLSIWVTLVAMAYTSNRVISLCHVLGAILLAFGTTYNKHALWVYLMPTIIGIIIIGINWGVQCRRTGRLFPARTYLKLYMPLGSFLVLMGLISFAFLETKENYKIVHSLWHVVMALSLIFLLPNKKTFIPKH